MIATALAALVLAAPPATAARPSILHIATDKWMAGVFVDGTPLTRDDCTSPKACTVTDITPGKHEIDIRGGLGGKVLYKGFVTIEGGSEIFAKANDGKLDVYNSQPRVYADDGATDDAAESTTTTVQQTTTVSGGQPDGGVSIGMTVTDPTTGQTVHLGAAAGANGAMGASQTTTTTTTTTTTGGGDADVFLGTRPSRPHGAGALELTSEDGQSFTVYIDGKKMGTFNGLEGESMKLKNVQAGEHKLVIKDFMEHQVFTTGRLYMDPNFTLKLGVTESSVEAFNNQNAWQQY